MRTYNFLTEFPTLHPMNSYPCMSIHPLIPMIELFQNLTFKIQGQSHSSRSYNRNNILSTHIPFIPCWWALPFLRCSYLKIDLEIPRSRVRSKLKVITWVLHSVDSHPFRSMSIGHPVPELWLFQNLTLKIKGQGHGWGHSSKSQGGSNILSTHIPFVPCQSGIPLLS